jgi:hypothetical protein
MIVVAILTGIVYVTVNILPGSVTTGDIGALVFVILSFFFFCWIGIYVLSQKNYFFSPIVNGEIKVAEWQNLPSIFFGKIAPGSYIDKDGKEQNGPRHVEKRTGEIKAGETGVSILEKLFGVVWIGFPPYGKIRKWKLDYTKWDNDAKDGKKIVSVLDKDVESLHPRPTFAFIVKDAETADKVPLTIQGKYTLSLVNAMSAIYSNKNWVINIDSAIVSAIVDYLRTVNFDAFMAMKIELGKDFLPDIKKINVNGVGNQSIGRYGFMLEDINIMTITVGGSVKTAIEEATTAEMVALKKAKEKVAEAQGKSDAAKIEAEGIAAGIEAMRRALGENSDQIVLLKIAEALGKQQNPWALGGGILPTMDLSSKPKKNDKEEKK